MTDTKKIIKILRPEILKLIEGQNSSELVQKGLDNKENPSIAVVKKGTKNGRRYIIVLNTVKFLKSMQKKH